MGVGGHGETEYHDTEVHRHTVTSSVTAAAGTAVATAAGGTAITAEEMLLLPMAVAGKKNWVIRSKDGIYHS